MDTNTLIQIGDKIKYRQENFSRSLIGWKIGIVVEIRPYMLTRQYVIFCVIGWICPDGKEIQPNFIGEVHDLYPRSDSDRVEIIEKGCPFNRLVVAVRVKPIGSHNAYVIIEEEYKALRDYFKSDCFREISSKDLDDILEGVYQWRTEIRPNFDAAYVHNASKPT